MDTLNCVCGAPFFINLRSGNKISCPSCGKVSDLSPEAQKIPPAVQKSLTELKTERKKEADNKKQAEEALKKAAKDAKDAKEAAKKRKK